MDKYVAVLDIGKTNKKVLIFNSKLDIIDSVYKNISADESKDIHIERTAETASWFFEQLAIFAKKYQIVSISISTHGATFVCLDKDGNLALPVIAYTTNPGEQFQDKFFEKYGNERDLHKEFATCNLGGLTNIAKGIEFIKQRYPKEFQNTKMILNYPQYFGYLLTGKYGIEPTFLGCHTYLWNAQERQLSRFTKLLDIENKVPKNLQLPHSILGTVKPELEDKLGISKDAVVSFGVHDSNASLIPYLIKSNDNFILNSTGTWCVSMCPCDIVEYTENDITTGIFHNVNIFGNPVKTSVFMGGEERSFYAKILSKYCNLEGYPDFDQEIYNDIFNKNEIFIFPGVMQGTGPFPKSTSRIIHKENIINPNTISSKDMLPTEFHNPKYGYAIVNIFLAIQTSIMLQNIGLKDGTTIFIEGGFRYNTGYHSVLSALCPNANIVISNLEEATAFGAALLGLSAYSNKNPNAMKNEFDFSTKKVKTHSFENLNKYLDKYLDLCV